MSELVGLAVASKTDNAAPAKSARGRRDRRIAVLLGSASIAIALPGAAQAQDAGAPAPRPAAFADAQTAPVPQGSAVDDIVVTALKRSENVQNVPLSIIAKSGEQLAQAGIANIADLPRIVPNLSFVSNSQASSAVIRIRGFGSIANSAVDPDVASYIDGVYMARPGAMLTSFLDVATVEVLRGPQGTLFGRNSVIGAISVTTNRPLTAGTSGEAYVEYGNYNEVQTHLILNMPVTGNFGLRGAVLYKSSDGFIRDTIGERRYGGTNTFAGRLSAKWDLSSNVTWLVRGDYAKMGGSGFNLAQFDAASASPAQIQSFVAKLGGTANAPNLDANPTYNAHQRFDDPSLDDRQFGFSSELSWEFGSGFTLRLIDSYRQWRNRQQDGDIMMTPLDILNRRGRYSSDSQSHELQFLSPKDVLLGGRLNFVMGAYHFVEDYKTRETLDLGSQFCSFILPLVGQTANIATCAAGSQLAGTVADFSQRATSTAGYVQADFKIVPSLTLTFGARETFDRKTGVFRQSVANPSATFIRAVEYEPDLRISGDRPTWRANLSWKPIEDVMVYASYSTGYKSGGFNQSGGAPALNAVIRTFQPETSTEYQAGIKSMFLDHRLLFNINFFQTDLHNFQDKSFNGVTFVVRNAGDIRARGIEFDGQIVPVRSVKLDFSGAYLDSRYSSNVNAPGLPACTGAVNSCPRVQDLTGQPTQYAPNWQYYAGAEYTTPPFLSGFTAVARVQVSYTGSMFTTNDNNPQSIIPGRTLLGARLNILSPGKTWTLSIFGDNLTNVNYFNYKFQQLLAGPLGGNNASTGATLLRGYLGAPATVGVALRKTF